MLSVTGIEIEIIEIIRSWIMCSIPQLKVFASFQRQLCLGLAVGALQPQNNLLGGLCFLMKDRLRLTTIT